MVRDIKTSRDWVVDRGYLQSPWWRSVTILAVRFRDCILNFFRSRVCLFVKRTYDLLVRWFSRWRFKLVTVIWQLGDCMASYNTGRMSNAQLMCFIDPIRCMKSIFRGSFADHYLNVNYARLIAIYAWVVIGRAAAKNSTQKTLSRCCYFTSDSSVYTSHMSNDRT